MSVDCRALLGRMKGLVPEDEVRYHERFWTMIYAVYYDRIVDEIVSKLPGPARSVADCGAGYGYWSCFLAHKGLSVAAIDTQAACLAVLRATAAALPAVTPIARDIHDLQALGRDTYDVAFSFATLHVARDPARALKEMAAITRRGGSIVIGISNVEHPVNHAFWKDAANVNYDVTQAYIAATLAADCALVFRRDSYSYDNRILAAYGEIPLFTFSVHQKRV
ncbi:MAG: class I SAM-dependent methyltransferase [Deltaproteobacteria bacterium]|nr:class I SAM-dependent methyltransferase [Deltaproteobacteria bacterium]